MANIDYELVLKIFGVIAAVVAAVYQFRNVKLSPRSSIKTDLEILKLLDSDDENYILIKNHIDRSIKRIYRIRKENKFKIYSIPLFIMGILFLLGFSVWTYYISRNGFSYWSLLTGFFAIAGIVYIFQAFDPE